MNKVIDIGATSGGKIVLAIIVLIVGLLLAVLIMPVVRAIRHEKQDTRFALVPFLSAGQLALYYI